MVSATAKAAHQSSRPVHDGRIPFPGIALERWTLIRVWPQPKRIPSPGVALERWTLIRVWPQPKPRREPSHHDHTESTLSKKSKNLCIHLVDYSSREVASSIPNRMNCTWVLVLVALLLENLNLIVLKFKINQSIDGAEFFVTFGR